MDRKHASPAIIKLVKNKTYSVKQAFEDTVQAAYNQRDLSSKIQSITARLIHVPSGKKLDPNLRTILVALKEQVDRILGSGK